VKRLKRSPLSPQATGFSVIEILVVVAVIGVMSSIAIGFFSHYHREVMIKVRDRRNAQEITALTMGATASGAEVVVSGNLEATIQNLIEGRESTQSAFKGHSFRLTQLSPDEIVGALQHLQWKDGMPTYLYGEE